MNDARRSCKNSVDRLNSCEFSYVNFRRESYRSEDIRFCNSRTMSIVKPTSVDQQRNITIRPEQVSDHDEIYEITKRAFEPMPFAAGDEQDLINALRAAGALALSLVAVQGDDVVGHIAFSPAEAADASPGWFALGPVAVAPQMQRQGIGSLLINEGIWRLRAMNASGCVLVGNPAYYVRFGFRPFPNLTPPGEPPKYFMILPLAHESPTSIVTFHPLFHENL